MLADELKKITTNILSSLQDQGKVSELLLKLEQENEKLESEKLSNIENLDKLKNDNESLRKANNNLFVQLGQKVKDVEQTEERQEEEEQELKFENLFNEKGELK